MRNFVKRRPVLTFLVIGLFSYMIHASWLRAYGRTVATYNCSIGSVAHLVYLRERNISGLTEFIILDRIFHGRGSDYEYWTELRRGRHLVAVSDRCSWDSMNYMDPRIDTADAVGTTISLDPRPPYQIVHHFPWLFPVPTGLPPFKISGMIPNGLALFLVSTTM